MHSQTRSHRMYPPAATCAFDAHLGPHSPLALHTHATLTAVRCCASRSPTARRYEPPINAEITVGASGESKERCVETVLSYLEKRGALLYPST